MTEENELDDLLESIDKKTKKNNGRTNYTGFMNMFGNSGKSNDVLRLSIESKNSDEFIPKLESRVKNYLNI